MISRADYHVSQGLSRLLEQYREQPNVVAILTTYLEEVQALENTIDDVIQSRYLDNAEGAQLDIIGAIVGELRQGRGDDLFKLWIAARILLNTSKGTLPDILACLRAVTSLAVTLKEYSPAHLELSFADPIPELANAYAEIVNEARAGGVSLAVVWPVGNGANGFVLKSVGESDDPEQGFQEIAY